MANFTGKPSSLRNFLDQSSFRYNRVIHRLPPVQARHHDVHHNDENSNDSANLASELNNLGIHRRSLLSLAATTAAAAAATLGGGLLLPAAIAAPPALSQTFQSSEGFEFSYPSGWIVAYDRSGGRGDGAVAAVGNFSQYLLVSVFRTVDIPKDVKLDNGLTESVGRALCIEPLLKDDTTQSFKELKSESNGEGRRRYYDFEYEIEICKGEIQEGAGGVLRCYGGLGQEIPTQKRHHLARAVLSGGHLLTINAAAPVDKWAEVEDVMREIVDSYRSL
jgi:hypothetical protein